MATLDSKEIPATPPPITPEELRDHEVMEKLLETQPELQEKTGVMNALTKGVKEFKFTKQDLINSIGFGAIFGTVFGVMGLGVGLGIESLLGENGGFIAHHIKDICGAFGLSLGAHSAIMHPFADMTKDFYHKCKDGWSEAKEHNKAVAYLRDRVGAIKAFKEKNFAAVAVDGTETSLPAQFAAAEDGGSLSYNPQRSRVVDAILEKKRDASSSMPWVERTEAKRSTTPTVQPTLF